MSAHGEDDVVPDDRLRRPPVAFHRTDVPATGEPVPALRHQLTTWATTTGMTDDQIQDLVLAADEAMSNVVSHAYDQDAPGTFDVHATHHPEQKTVRVTVRDHGQWRSAVPGPGPQHGRGLNLIRALADEAVIERSPTGTTVRMTWLLASRYRTTAGPRRSRQVDYHPPQFVWGKEDRVVDESGSTRRLSSLLRDNSEDLIGRWVRLAAPALRGRLTETELSREIRELFAAIRPMLTDGTATEAETAQVKALLNELSGSRARQGFTPSETATSVFALKQAVFELVEHDPDATLFLDMMALSRTLDMLGLWTFEAWAHSREDIIREQSEQLLELTTPVVKLWDGVLAVPLVGTLDSARTQVVMEKLLDSLVETGSEHAIIDITGVLAVDTQVAQHLVKTVAAARLMGAECTISGIRPQIAQTIVALGIDLGGITTKASLADALLHAFRSGGVDVVYRNRKSS